MELSKDEWLSVLSLSTTWSFHTFRHQAITRLSSPSPHPLSLDPVERVKYGTQHHVARWVREGFRDLITRDASINTEEARTIGFEIAIRVYQLRDEHIKGKSLVQFPTIETKVAEVFSEELKAIEKEEFGQIVAELKGVEKVKEKQSSVLALMPNPFASLGQGSDRPASASSTHLDGFQNSSRLPSLSLKSTLTLPRLPSHQKDKSAIASTSTKPLFGGFESLSASSSSDKSGGASNKRKDGQASKLTKEESTTNKPTTVNVPSTDTFKFPTTLPTY